MELKQAFTSIKKKQKLHHVCGNNYKVEIPTPMNLQELFIEQWESCLCLLV